MLPNKAFINFPIEFKEINKEDFDQQDKKPFMVKDKTIIYPNKDGFIYDGLKEAISLEDKETIVINAPVGCGKSYSILRIINHIIKEDVSATIVISPPFVSLITQYLNDVQLVSGLSRDLIYDYSDLGRNPRVPYENKKVHIITTNTLLGNPGEDGFKNSEAKREYLNKIVDECIRHKRRVYFIYDEIHDSIHNFKEEFIFNLWKWKDVIHKNILISATYNEASKVVIEYLAELTDRKISIIEVPRVPIPEKQSKLYLHYCSDFNFTTKTEKIVSVVDNLLQHSKNIDILCYSKILAKNIIADKKGIGKKLSDAFGSINNCTSELVSNQRGANQPPKNTYDNRKCNVGTNFKSGVNIVKDNHALIIIFPPRASRQPYRNLSGIFSGGIVSVIQAIARQRQKGEIHLILPRPDPFNYESLKNASMSESQIEVFKKYYDNIYYRGTSSQVEYLSINNQEKILHNFYHNVLIKEVEDSIKKVEENELKGMRQDLPRLKYPPYEIFKLNTGEDYLANKFPFFGELVKT